MDTITAARNRALEALKKKTDANIEAFGTTYPDMIYDLRTADPLGEVIEPKDIDKKYSELASQVANFYDRF